MMGIRQLVFEMEIMKTKMRIMEEKMIAMENRFGVPVPLPPGVEIKLGPRGKYYAWEDGKIASQGYLTFDEVEQLFVKDEDAA